MAVCLQDITKFFLIVIAMKQKTIILVLTASFISIFTIFILFINSNTFDRRYEHNSFNRSFHSDPMDLSGNLDLKYNSYYLAGTTTNHIYLGNSTAPTHLLIADISLKDIQRVQLKLERFLYKSILVKVDSPYFYLMDGTIPFIYKGNVNDWYGNRYMHDTTFFLEAIPISNHSFALRAMTTESNENVLAKKTMSPSHLKYSTNILEKQIDGIFCTDGMLHYDKYSSNLVYMYFYRNQFMCIDTSLNLLYKANTIDTISQAQIKVANIRSEERITMASPPLLVNRASCVSNGWLFINSNLLAKNEDKKAFDQAAVIDVYNLQEGRYKFSFYIPDYKEKRVRSFEVSDYTLITLYDHYILTYKLNKQLFRE